VALLTGCAQRALNADINASTIRLLTRHGYDVVIAEGIGCCGALDHHMGQTASSHRFAEANIRAWMREVRGEGLDAVIINTSGCGTTVKDYGYMLRNEPLAEDAAHISSITRDISQFMAERGLDAPQAARPMRIAYHAACSLQHGQQVTSEPKALLKAAGFRVVEPRDAHLCCGSAGTYNLLQPAIASELKRRKVATIEKTAPEAIATGNIGCMMQIGGGTDIPVVHTADRSPRRWRGGEGAVAQADTGRARARPRQSCSEKKNRP
jgi:glycolate oxidase iron-sulfur subunit